MTSTMGLDPLNKNPRLNSTANSNPWLAQHVVIHIVFQASAYLPRHIRDTSHQYRAKLRSISIQYRILCPVKYPAIRHLSRYMCSVRVKTQLNLVFCFCFLVPRLCDFPCVRFHFLIFLLPLNGVVVPVTTEDVRIRCRVLRRCRKDF